MELIVRFCLPKSMFFQFEADVYKLSKIGFYSFRIGYNVYFLYGKTMHGFFAQVCGDPESYDNEKGLPNLDEWLINPFHHVLGSYHSFGDLALTLATPVIMPLIHFSLSVVFGILAAIASLISMASLLLTGTLALVNMLPDNHILARWTQSVFEFSGVVAEMAFGCFMITALFTALTVIEEPIHILKLFTRPIMTAIEEKRYSEGVAELDHRPNQEELRL